MDAIKLEKTRFRVGDDAEVEIVIWRVPEPVPGSRHYFKYRLALIVGAACVLRYDNEAGKGDHRHVDDQQHGYDFVGVDALRRDFLLDAEGWLERHDRR
jgi:hypothetical protein